MKNIIRSVIVCLVAVLVLSSVCTVVYADGFTIGGIAPSVYIRNMSDYIAFRNEVAAGKTFEGELVMLSAKLEFPGDFAPIGDDTHRFEGTFDGRGYTITVSAVGETQTSAENFGLFAVIGEKGTVRNVWIEGSVEGNRAVGGIAGVNCGLVENCYSYVAVKGVGENPTAIGAIVGENRGTVKNSFARFFSAESAPIGTDNGTTEVVYNKDTETFVSLGALNAGVAENETYISWFWGWSGYPMVTREHGGHTFVNIDGIAPTCEYSGQTAGMMCSVCGEIGGGYRVLKATGAHSPMHIDAVSATCTEEGHTEGEICELCGKVLSGLEVIEPSHGELVTVEEVPPTATEDGVSSGVVCSVCGEKIEGFEPIPATGEIEEEIPDELPDASDETETAEQTGAEAQDETDVKDSTGDSGKDETDESAIGGVMAKIRSFFGSAKDYADKIVDKLNAVVITQDQFIFGTVALGVLILAIVGIVALVNRKKNEKE